jgi:hypothetical protein
MYVCSSILLTQEGYASLAVVAASCAELTDACTEVITGNSPKTGHRRINRLLFALARYIVSLPAEVV